MMMTLMLQRIEEHDSMIHWMSQSEERDRYLPDITTILGIRGHMYGELIRIQMMLANDDPQLQVAWLLYHQTVCLSVRPSLHLSPARALSSKMKRRRNQNFSRTHS